MCSDVVAGLSLKVKVRKERRRPGCGITWASEREWAFLATKSNNYTDP
jgi:hypothetical protein